VVSAILLKARLRVNPNAMLTVLIYLAVATLQSKFSTLGFPVVVPVAVLMVVLVSMGRGSSKMLQIATFLEVCFRDSHSLIMPIGAPRLSIDGVAIRLSRGFNTGFDNAGFDNAGFDIVCSSTEGLLA
jgi:hypothetical protein